MSCSELLSRGSQPIGPTELLVSAVLLAARPISVKSPLTRVWTKGKLPPLGTRPIEPNGNGNGNGPIVKLILHTDSPTFLFAFFVIFQTEYRLCNMVLLYAKS